MRTHISASAGARKSLKIIPISKVIYFFASDKYVNAVYEGGELIMLDTLLELEEEFPFLVRISRSALVPIDRITGFIQSPRAVTRKERSERAVTLEGSDERLRVNQEYMESVYDRLIKETGPRKTT